MLHRIHLRNLSIFALPLAAACGTELSEDDADDIASSVAALTAEAGGETEGFSDLAQLTRGVRPAGMNGRSGRFSGRRGELEYLYSAQCQDETGAAQAECNADSDRAEISVSWSGAWSNPRHTANMSRAAEWVLEDIQSGTAQLTGTGTVAFDHEFAALRRQATRSYHLEASGVYDVQVDVETRRPVGGTIVYTVHAERHRDTQGRDVEATRDATVEVTFGADGVATIQIDGAYEYEVTLADGTVRQGSGSKSRTITR